MARQPVEYPSHVEGLTHLCKLIERKFGFTLSKQYICAKLRKDPKYIVPFPKTRAGNQFVVKEVFDWLEKYYIPSRKGFERDLFKEAAEAKARQTIREDEEHEFQFDLEQGLYIKKADADRTIKGFAKKMWAMVRVDRERHGPAQCRDKLRELGVSPETVAAFYEWHINMEKSMTAEQEQRFVDASNE